MGVRVLLLNFILLALGERPGSDVFISYTDIV